MAHSWGNVHGRKVGLRLAQTLCLFAATGAHPARFIISDQEVQMDNGFAERRQKNADKWALDEQLWVKLAARRAKLFAFWAAI